MGASRRRRRGAPTSFEWHCALAELLREDPTILPAARKRAARTAALTAKDNPGSLWASYARTWVDVLRRPVEEIAESVVAETAEWDRLRDYSPFEFGSDLRLRKLVTEQRRRAHPGRHGRSQAETRLARLRVERGLSQAELADAAGLSLSALWRLERNRIAQPLLSQVAACARVLDVAIEEVSEPEWLEVRRASSKRRPSP